MSSRNYENDSARLKRLTQNQRGSRTVPLQQSRSDPRNTGTTWPDAYGLVSHWNLQDQTGTAVVTVSWWASKADYDAGRATIEEEVQVLTPQEQQAGVVQLMGVLEALLLARDEYQTAGPV